ncbi:MAG: prepilin-type N-terminal cleavage/methylation domain-containing protein [Patescibacteria group bacterium]
MLQARRIKNNAVRGFTLVELLVTISIIGVLASITVVSVGNVRQIARDSKRLADIKQLQTALEFYFNQQNGYPAGTDITLGTGDQSVLCITADATRGFEDTVNDCAGNGAGPVYMSRVPSNPIPGGLANGYLYNATDPGNFNNRRPSQYTIQFQLETDIAGFSRGVAYLATPAGIRR